MSKPVIVCVDDEPSVLESLKIELKRVLNGSCLIETAEGGEEALELIKELQEGDYEVALVLADYIMPDIKGDELLREIHERSPHTLNIMISGQANLEAVSNAIREAKLFRYIPKPWQSDDLQTSVIEAIQSFLQDRKLEAQTNRLQQLYQQVQEFNQVLEQQVEERTAQLEQLYQLSQLQVQELERLSQVKDDFLSSISHELRSPMSNIHMAIQMLETIVEPLQEKVPELRPATRYLQILHDECQRETQLINDLLDMAQLEAGAAPLNLTSIDLSLWLPIIAEPFIERTRNQQQFLLDIASDITDLTTDSLFLERALKELLHNACKYTPLGETILLTAQMNRSYFQISIKNSGVEIPISEHERIFDKFYRIANSDRRKQGGSGLGLALVKKQIERLQGTIVLTSEPGWTVFTLQIPDLCQSSQSS